MAHSSERPRVLVADGDGSELARTVARLGRAGYDVVVAHDGEEALACARAERPDVCVLDALTPKLTGYDVTRRLRADAATSDLPILLLTALPLDASAFDPGADGYVRKPVSVQEIPDRVGALLERRGLRTPPAASARRAPS